MSVLGRFATTWLLLRGRRFAFQKNGEIFNLRTGEYIDMRTAIGVADMRYVGRLRLENIPRKRGPQPGHVIAAWLIDDFHGQQRAADHAVAVMSWCEAIFPKRVASEEIGDALELIDRWRRDRRKHVRAKISVKVVSTIVVLALNSIRFVVSSFAGKKVE